jgi:hypothetical protein
MITPEFITAGRATFTVEPASEFHAAMKAAGKEVRPHYTYRVECAQKDHSCVFFVKALTGPDNENDFRYLGVLDPHQGSLRLTPRSAFAAGSIPAVIALRVLSRIFAGQGEQIERAGWRVHHAGKCGRCGRTLTTPESCATGIGPECRKVLKRGRRRAATPALGLSSGSKPCRLSRENSCECQRVNRNAIVLTEVERGWTEAFVAFHFEDVTR